MKKTILNIFAVAALLLCSTASFAQGVKITKTDNTVIDIPASELKSIEAYDKAPAFEGTWKMKELVTTAEYMSEVNWGMVTFGEEFPAQDLSDEITFKDGKIIPKFNSKFKNFFKGEATYEIVDEAYELHPMSMAGYSVTLTELKVKGVNRNFDANNVSEDDEAYIGVRLVEDVDADEAGIFYLEIYLMDFKATSFAPEWNDYMMYDENKPMAALSGMPIWFKMDKVESTPTR